MKKQKGITLTALVITIIVMLILVVVVISFASRDEGILTNAKTASAETEEKAMLEELISMAEFDEDGRINAEATKDKAMDKYSDKFAFQPIESGGYLVTITGKTGTTYTYTITENGIKIGEENPSGGEDSNNIIPDGGMYVVGFDFENMLIAGQEFPELSIGDIYFYGDYAYVYCEDGDISFGGWSVSILNSDMTADKNKSSYGEILESVNGKPIKSLSGTFGGCTALTSAPVIPGSVTEMDSTFSDCTALTSAPVIPDSVENMRSTFYGCIALTTAPDIPENVEDMRFTFSGCESLSGEITINANPSEFGSCLYNTGITTILGATPIKTELLDTRYDA